MARGCVFFGSCRCNCNRCRVDNHCRFHDNKEYDGDGCHLDCTGA